MSSALTLESATGILSWLKDDDPRLKTIALKKIDKQMQHYWHEISNFIPQIEALQEDETFPDQKLAALIASKIHYHLESYDVAVDYALQAGPLFDVNERNQYVDCLIGKCIDRYITERQSNFEKSSDDGLIQIDNKLEEVVEKIFSRCIKEKESKMVLGVAIDARRIDKIKEILENESSEILDYLTRLAANVTSRKFRVEIFKIIVDAYQRRPKIFADYINLAQSYFILDDSESLAALLLELVKQNEEEKELLAYQIATDINENENNFYFEKVIEHLNKAEGLSNEISNCRANLTKILSGRFKNELYLTFLKEKNQTDPAVINNLKTITDIKNSVAHGGVLFANALMNAGTTGDSFLRTNTDWVAKASHWSRFSATASLGAIHKGNYNKAMEILQPYFPGATGTPNMYTHGGSLYALGLIHYGDKDQDVINYLIQQIKSSDNANDQIVHGACLGLGLVCLASENEDNHIIYEDLRNVLFTDSANTGEAAGLAIGMSMLGSANLAVIEELVDYARETQHEKIIRAISLALAFIMYGKEEKADGLIEQLSLDKDGIIRYGAMYMIGLAYVGTSNNTALQKLLHFAVSDVSDDVRRAAVINVGLLMLKQPEQVPKILSLLAMSYNPSVRYGSTLAIGIACAGTAQKEALAMLEPMLNDSSDFVRQGAYLATAMVLQQATVAMEPKVEKFKTQVEEIIKKKHEDPLARIGALLSQGILDAGGRNASISLLSQFKYPKIASVIGMVLFMHFWYWFPAAHCLLLALSPTTLIGVNKNLKVPRGFKYRSDSKPSLYAYPEHIKENKEKEKTKTTTVQLSVTQKAKARALAKKHGDMDIEDKKEDNKIDIEKEQTKEEEKKKEEEPDHFILENPSRVLPRQRPVISFLDDNRYKPILKERKNGIVFLLDTKASENEEFFGEEPVKAPATANTNKDKDTKIRDEDVEVAAPDSFRFEDETQKLLD